MSSREWTTPVETLALLCLGAPLASAAEVAGDDGLAAALRAPVAESIAAYGKKDAAGTLSRIDTRSPDYESTKLALDEQFKDLDVTAELVDFDYIGHDDEFAVARVKMKTTGKPKSGFADNTVDSIMIFHYQDGAWKIWTEKVLGVEIAK